MDNQLIIGLDGGGTNTTCILFDSNGFTMDTIYDKGSNLYVFKDDAIQLDKVCFFTYIINTL